MGSIHDASTVKAKVVLLQMLLDDLLHFDESKALLLQVHAWNIPAGRPF